MHVPGTLSEKKVELNIITDLFTSLISQLIELFNVEMTG